MNGLELILQARPGDVVEYWQYAGRGLEGPEYKPASGKVVIKNPASLVLNIGGKWGTPAVVDERNITRIKRKA